MINQKNEVKIMSEEFDEDETTILDVIEEEDSE